MNILRRIPAILVVAAWLPAVVAGVAMWRFSGLPEDTPTSLLADLALLWAAGLPSAACIVIAWPPRKAASRRLGYPVAIAFTVLLGLWGGTVGGLLGPIGVLVGGAVAALPMLGPAIYRLRNP